MIDKLLARLTRKLTRERMDEFLKTHATSKQTLEIGAAGNSNAEYFPNRIALNISKSRYINVLADAHYLPFKDASFDVVLCTEVLEHLQEPQRAIDEMRRILKDGAKLILTTRFIYPLHETPGDYYRFTKYGLRYLLRNWGDVDVEDETDTFGGLAVILQRMGFQCDYRIRLFKYIPLVMAQVVKHLNFLIKKEYGVFYKKIPDENIMTSGYYVIARK